MLPEKKPEIIINKELSLTILGVDLRNLPQRTISIFKIKMNKLQHHSFQIIYVSK
jgi:hypothetical protein